MTMSLSQGHKIIVAYLVTLLPWLVSMVSVHLSDFRSANQHLEIDQPMWDPGLFPNSMNKKYRKLKRVTNIILIIYLKVLLRRKYTFSNPFGYQNYITQIVIAVKINFLMKKPTSH